MIMNALLRLLLLHRRLFSPLPKFRHYFRSKKFNLSLGLVPGHEPLVEIPAKPLEVSVLAQRIQFALNVVARADQLVLGLHHAFVGVGHRPRLTREAVRLKEPKAGEVFDEARARRMRARGSSCPADPLDHPSAWGVYPPSATTEANRSAFDRSGDRANKECSAGGCPAWLPPLYALP